MQFYSENKRLKDAQAALESISLTFGPNKKQELIRLMYEVSRIQNTTPWVLLKAAVSDHELKGTKQAFTYLKNYFIHARFPKINRTKQPVRFYLPKINFDGQNEVKQNDVFVFYPENILIEKSAKDYNFTRLIIDKFPLARVKEIEDLDSHIQSISPKTQIRNYNERSKNLFLIKEKGDFIKPCPCSKDVLRCGYYILNLGFGCPYECSYCFLQSYTNIPGIVMPVNIDDFLSGLSKFLEQHTGYLRIGTGEFTDSLALDDITQYSRILVEFFSKCKNAILELKTKSNNIDNILGLKHNKKTVISWSLNPQSLIDSDEWLSNNLEERLNAARACCEAGYEVGFHFDPIIYSSDWQGPYEELIDRLFDTVQPKNISWISLGTFRFSPKLKTVIEQRFPKSRILDEELVIGFDKKLRYGEKQRVEIYKKMFTGIKRYSSSVLVYLCMEPSRIWKEVLGRARF